MTLKRKDQYAKAILEIATAEGNLEKITNELYAFSEALTKSRDLYTALADRSIPFQKRNQIIYDLLSKKASAATLGIISLVVSAGRIKDFEDIVVELSAQVSQQRNQEVAYVRSAIELNGAQTKKLEKALSQATNKQLDLKVVVDPNLLGGVVATIGDTVIDGSVKTKLQKFREKMESKQ